MGYFLNAGTGCCTECRESPCDPCGGCNLRVWNLQPYTANTATVSAGGATFGPFAAGDYVQGYNNIAPAGKYALTVEIGGQTFALDADFVADGYYTVFIREQSSGGPLSVVILDDNWQEGDPVRVRVHQLSYATPDAPVNHFPIAASGIFQVSNHDGGPDDDPPPTYTTVGGFGPLNYGDDQLVTGLPVTGPYLDDGQGDDENAIGVSYTATFPDGQTGTWNGSFNTHIQRLLDILILPDPYGRFRPSIVASGPDFFDASN